MVAVVVQGGGGAPEGGALLESLMEMNEEELTDEEHYALYGQGRKHIADASNMQDIENASRGIIIQAVSGPSRGQWTSVVHSGSIGRHGTVFSINESSLSDHNTLIEYLDGKYWLRDLDSKHGTFIKIGEDCDHEYLLQMGDVIMCGNTECSVLAHPRMPQDPRQKACCVVQ